MNKKEKNVFSNITLPLVGKFISMLKKRNRLSEAGSFSSFLPKFVSYISDGKPYIDCISDIDRIDIEDYLLKLRTEDYDTKGHQENRNCHVYRHLRAVNKFFEYLTTMEDDLNPCDLPKPDIIRKRDFPRPNRRGVKHFPAWLDKLMLQEIRELPEENPIDLKFKTMMLFIYQTGSRIFDLCTLEYNCTFEKLGFIWVRIFSNKTKNEYEIPITLELNNYLKKYCQVQKGAVKRHPTSLREMKFLFWITGDAKIFTDRMARKLKIFTHAVKIKAEEQGWPIEDISELPLTSHKFRHSVGIRLIRMGADPLLVAEFLGHKNMGMAQAYIQESEQEIEDVMNGLVADNSLELETIDDIVDEIVLSREQILNHKGVVCKCLGGLCTQIGGKTPCGQDAYDCWLCDNLGPDLDEPNYLQVLEKELREHEELEERNLKYGYLGAAKVERQVIQRIREFREEWKIHHASKEGDEESGEAVRCKTEGEYIKRTKKGA